MEEYKVLITVQRWHRKQVTEFVNLHNISKEDFVAIHNSSTPNQLSYDIFFWGSQKLAKYLEEKERER